MMTRRYSLIVIVFTLSLCRMLLQAQDDSLLMSYAEYARLQHRVPYTVTLHTDAGSLLYFGSRHVHDSSNPQTELIQQHWNAFHPTVAFIEGGDPPVERTIDAAIKAHGEAGLVRFLAQRDSVPVHSLEPSMDQQVSYLVTVFSPEQLKVFYALRQVETLKKSGKMSSPRQEMHNVLGWLSKVHRLDGSPRTLAEFEACYTKLLMRRDWTQARSEWFDPVFSRPATYLNEVARMLSRFRDRHMIRLLLEEVRQGKRAFAIVGATHVVMQEPTLRAGLNEPSDYSK